MWDYAAANPGYFVEHGDIAVACQAIHLHDQYLMHENMSASTIGRVLYVSNVWWLMKTCFMVSSPF